MQSVDDWVSVEDLAAADRLVRITNALIELQRELLEHLHETGHDLTSAKTDFDSLLVSSCALRCASASATHNWPGAQNCYAMILPCECRFDVAPIFVVKAQH